VYELLPAVSDVFAITAFVLNSRWKTIARVIPNAARNGASGTSDMHRWAARVAARESGDERVQSHSRSRDHAKYIV